MSTHNPVLLLHGRISSHLQMGKRADYLSHLGWCTHSLSLEPRTGELGLVVRVENKIDYSLHQRLTDISPAKRFS